MNSSSPIVPFSYKDVLFVPGKLLLSFEIFQATMFFFSVLVFLILCHVVVVHSPKAMGAYRWYIIWNAFHGIGIGLMLLLFQPEGLLPYPVVICRGITSLFKIPEFVIYILIDFAILFIGGTTYTTCCMFVFRFAQTTQNKYTVYLSEKRFYALAYLIYCLILFSFVILPLNFQLLSTEGLRASMKGVNQEVYAKMQGNFEIIGLNVESANYVVFAGISALIIFMILALTMIICYIVCNSIMMKNRTKVHGKTAKLYRSLMTMLLIDVLGAIILVFIPILFLIFGLVNSSNWNSLSFQLAVALADTYPLATNLLIILYIEPYRKHVLVLFGCKKGKISWLRSSVTTDGISIMHYH